MDESKKPSLSFLSIRNRRDTFENEKRKGAEIAEEVAYQEAAPQIHQELPTNPYFPGNDPRVKKQLTPKGAPKPLVTYSSPDEEEVDFDIFKYLGIILVRKWWFLGSFILVMVFGVYVNNSKPIAYSCESTLAIKTNPIQETVGSLLLGRGGSGKSVISHHQERLRLPEENFLRSVSERLDLPLSIKEIEGAYSVRQAGESDLLVISVTHKEAQIAKSLADAVASAYEDYDLLFRQRNYLEQESWIKQQIVQRKTLLEELEIKVKEFHETHPTFNDKAQAKDILEIESELKNLELVLEENAHRKILIQSSLKNADSVVVSEVTRDKPLQKELLNLEVELARLKVDHGDQSRKVQQTLEQMRNIKSLIRQDAEDKSYTTILQSNPRYQELLGKQDDLLQEVSVQQARKRELEKLLERAYKATSTQPELQLQYSRLVRDKIASEKIYTMLTEKLEETRLQKSGVTREAYQIGRASNPKKLDRGRISLWMNIVLALAVGMGVCFLIEQLDKTIRFPVEIEKNFKIPVLGIIPEQEADKGRLTLESDSKLIEPYRSLRTNLNYSSVLAGKKGKAIIITSALQGEGKSTKAVNLAICFSLDGQKILLVDADLRRPSVHGLLSQERGPGLSEFLTGQSNFPEVIQKTQYHNLSIVSAGNKMPNPAEILGSPRVSEFLQEACAEFDLVFFDSPAIFPVSDALVLAPLMDGALVIFRSNYTPIKAGEDVLRKLGQVGASVIGGVLNDVQTGRGGYYYSYYGYYGYSYYHNYYEETHPNPRHPFLWQLSKDFQKRFDKFKLPGIQRAKAPDSDFAADSSFAKGNWDQFRMGLLKFLLAIPVRWIYLILTLGITLSLILAVLLRPDQVPDYIPLGETEINKKYLKQTTIKPVFKVYSFLSPDTTQVLKLLNIWKQSQELGNLDLYTSLYSVPAIEAEGKSFLDWKDKLQDYFTRAGIIQVEMGTLTWANGKNGQIWTRFPNTLITTNGVKQFERHILWGREHGKWRIIKDGVMPLKTPAAEVP